MKGKVLSFGELLLRISPSPAEKQPFTSYIGGAEVNTASALAQWGVPTAYFTALPDNFVSENIISHLQSFGIDTSAIKLFGDRQGIYYLAQGADLKSSVVYDRTGSSFANLTRGIIDWDAVLEGVCWLNMSAISPAINAAVADVCLEALEAASQKNITISIDLNYRSRLWKYGKEPIDIMPALVQYCDVIMGNIWAANTMLGITVEPNIPETFGKNEYLQLAHTSSVELVKKFPRCKHVGYTFRFDQDAQDVRYYSSLYSGGGQYSSSEYKTNKIVDRSGSGDCFMAGLIYGFYNQHPPQDIVNFATAAAFGKLHEKGDSTQMDVGSVKSIHQDQDSKVI
ncbi:MAG TPA: sugar kinase [Pedobacter sp.]